MLTWLILLKLTSLKLFLQCSFRRGLFRSPSTSQVPKYLAEKSKSFKRESCHEGEDTPHFIKRRKSVIDRAGLQEEKKHVIKKPTVRLQRCHSASEAMIKSAMSRCDSQQDLIGDFSWCYSLPLIQGKHQDLKCITPDTLADVMTGKYCDVIEQVVIVDCRYPYEYKGGLIKGAVNYYTKGNIMDEFLRNNKHELYASRSSTRRTILVFHCEFSSERGPNMARFLRNKDREFNRNFYPTLHYPEIYLLHGGYKNFFQTHKVRIVSFKSARI